VILIAWLMASGIVFLLPPSAEVKIEIRMQIPVRNRF